MIKRRIKTDLNSVFNKAGPYKNSNTASRFRPRRKPSAIFSESRKKATLTDYVQFVFYCSLLIMPVYAIAVSAIKQDWLMVAIDALLVPVGFVHGVLLIFGIVS